MTNVISITVPNEPQYLDAGIDFLQNCKSLVGIPPAQQQNVATPPQNDATVTTSESDTPPIPPAVTETAQPSVNTNELELDGNGVPWSEDVHSKPAKLSTKGVWRKRRGVSDDAYNKYVETALAQLGTTAPPPPPPPATTAQEPAAPAAPTPPPPPPATTTQEPATVSNDDLQRFENWVPENFAQFMIFAMQLVTNGHLTEQERDMCLSANGLTEAAQLNSDPTKINPVWQMILGCALPRMRQSGGVIPTVP